MPIKIPTALPAKAILLEEGVPLIEEKDAARQDIRPLKIAVLNLMPEKQKTEAQLARLLGATPLQINLTLLTTQSYESKNTSKQHLISFYEHFSDIKEQKFDGLIITGAPIEKKPFEDVSYWEELQTILDWSLSSVFSTLNICWAAQAALYHRYKVPKHALPQKLFGIYPHRVPRTALADPLMIGFNDHFAMPVSRHTETRLADLPENEDLHPLAISDKAGLAVLKGHKGRQVYVFNHFEYDRHSLRDEYERDLNAGRPIELPFNYFPDDNPRLPCENSWKSFAHLFFSNWIQDIYQRTPYDLKTLNAHTN